jgi:methyltransferase
MATSISIAAITLVAVLLLMAGEAALSAINERVLRARGFRPEGGEMVHALSLWVYPLCFVAMAVEGALSGPAAPNVLASGLVVFGLSKALKLWSITALGVRWTFRVLAHPDVPPITRGPYALLRHPNYVAVIGEIVGVGLTVWAPITGTLGVVGYGALLRRKIEIEDRALGRQ